MVVVEAVRGELARAEQQRPGRLTQGNAASVGQVRDDDRCRCCSRHAHDVAALAARMEVKLAALPESSLNTAPAGWGMRVAPPFTPLTPRWAEFHPHRQRNSAHLGGFELHRDGHG